MISQQRECLNNKLNKRETKPILYAASRPLVAFEAEGQRSVFRRQQIGSI